MPSESEVAIRFSWLPSVSNKLMIQYANEIKLYEFKEDDSVASPQLMLLRRINIGKPIESFKIRYNTVSKYYICFIIDTEGLFYSY